MPLYDEEPKNQVTPPVLLVCYKGSSHPIITAITMHQKFNYSPRNIAASILPVCREHIMYRWSRF